MRGLLMVEPLYHQTIKGVKTQTRRSGGLELVNESPDEWSKVAYGLEYPGEKVFSCMFIKTGPTIGTGIMGTEITCKPRYKVGEVLYLKEPYIKLMKTPDNKEYGYSFGCKFKGGIFSPNLGHTVSESGEPVKFKNKLFMPAEAARAYVRITDIKCERLLDISDEDCIAEGIEMVYNYPSVFYKYYLTPQHAVRAKESFLSLYKFANKVKEVPNLWVWAYSYELTTKP